MNTQTSPAQNKAMVIDLFNALDKYIETDPEKLIQLSDQVMDEKCNTYFASHTLKGRAAYIEHVKGARGAFANMEHNIEDIFAEGNKVATRVTFTAKHVGEFMGIKASGRLISTPIIYLHEFKDGKIANCWVDWDSFFVMKQKLEAEEAD